MAETLEVGVEVFAVPAFHRCVRDSLAFAAAVGGLVCAGGLVLFGGGGGEVGF